MTTGEPLLNRLEPQSEDEEGTWWLTSTAPVRDATGAVVGLVGSGRDITERLRTEKALQESEARQRALLAAMPDMVFRFDRAGTYLDYKADRVTDPAAPLKDILGRRVAEVLPSDVANLLEATIERVLASGDIETIEYTLEVSGNTSRLRGPAGPGRPRRGRCRGARRDRAQPGQYGSASGRWRRRTRRTGRPASFWR